MVEIVEKHILAVCGTEIPAQELEDSTDFEHESWFELHLLKCPPCKNDTKEALRQKIASLEGLLLTQTHSMTAYRQGMETRRMLLSTAKELLSDAVAQTPEWGLRRAAWIEKCNGSLDLSRP